MADRPAPLTAEAQASNFTGYQKFVAGMLAFLQFAVILDFMVMAPLGALIMPALGITPARFGMVVSAYAFSAGISGVLAAGFADRFDRKRLLLFFYAGFLGGTLWCAMAQSFESLLAARIVTGLFGGVIGSVLLAIMTDLYAPNLRGRAMGILQTAFAGSQIMGLPIALYLSNHWSWHAPFFMIVGVGILGGIVVVWRLQPVNAHLALPRETSAFKHLLGTVGDKRHLPAFATTALLTTGGFMLMPFSSVFTVNNLGIHIAQLPTIYLVTGLCTMFAGPLVGKAADRFGKMPVFLAGSVLTSVMVVTYTHLGPVPLPAVIAVNVILFIGIFSRMIPYQAMSASVPEPAKRGAFSAISAAIQQLSGGVAAVVAGHLVSTGADGKLVGFANVGYVVVCSTIVAGFLAHQVHRGIVQREALAAAAS
ncbi:MFS transporter [Massilia sp. CF038]|uniref:MFS transporter n=1 Tax=Massilia sp. CF038 TaxID=1881045 RepID=UPI000922B2A5|nr:MFS transporter [Massilia sp. CF038]SHG71662.1 Predicted arabinose efflux permease, MFS family [Massilia sp. CF038]